MTHLKSMYVLVSGVIAMIGCSSLPEYAAPKFMYEYRPEMADYIPYRKLERADFKARQPPHENSEHGELMAAMICVSIKPIVDQDAIDVQLLNSPNEEQVYRITYKNLRYRALMDRNCSWWNPETDATEESYILEHEQIHFALSELEARRWHESTMVQLNVKLGSPKAMAESGQKQFESYFEKLHKPTMAQDRKFDEETSVERNTDKQKQWWDLVQSQLSATASIGAPPDTELNEAAPEEGEEASKYGGYAGLLKLFEPLAEQGHIQPQYALGWMYFNGKGVTQDYKAAFKWYKRAAEQGHAKAQYNLGVMYAEGRGVPQDYEAAVKWTRLAAEQGNANAQSNLGVMTCKGNGVTETQVAFNIGLAAYKDGDFEGAFARWLPLAKSGHAESAFRVADMYDYAQGVQQDYKESAKWFLLAAECGHGEAQFRIANRYDSGTGVTRDTSKAYKWYWLCLNNGNTPVYSKYWADINLRSKFSVGVLSFSQINQIETEAKKWKPKPYLE